MPWFCVDYGWVIGKNEEHGFLITTYIILKNVMFYKDVEEFIHHPTWSWNEIHLLLSCAMTIN
jgi:hypothetical protein